MTFVGKDISSIYKKIAGDLDTIGQPVTTRDLVTRELFNVEIQLYDPRKRFVNQKARAMDMRYFVGELCYFLDGRIDLESIMHYSKFWERVSDDGHTVNSAYGDRLFSRHYNTRQFFYAVDVLLNDPSSRKAVMPIYRPEDSRESRDNPCTMFLQFVIRNNELVMLTHMRSNDFWLGIPYDVAFFTIVQEIAFIKLQDKYPKLRLGPYYHKVTSLHAYSKDMKGVRAVASEKDHLQILAPKLSAMDASNWFDDLLTYEKSKRGKVLYKAESNTTPFQDWCKSKLDE